MDTTKLMIGDWVKIIHTHREPTYEQIVGVGKTNILVKMPYGIDTFHCSRVEPINLTIDMLSNNGWITWKTNDGKRDCAEHNEHSLFFYNYNLEWDDSYLMHCSYVHNLQQALRLIEKYELADDFNPTNFTPK